MSPPMRSPMVTIVMAFAGMCLIWGSTWMMIKIGLRGAPPMTAVGLRFVLAGVLIGAIVASRRLRFPRSRKFLVLCAYLGVCHFAVPYLLVYWAEQQISSGLTAVLYSTMPFMVAILARGLVGDSLDLRKVIGIVIGVAGVWFIFADSVQIGGRQGILGVCAVLLSVAFAGLSTVVLKKYGRQYNALVMLVIPFWLAGLLALAFAVPIEQSNPLTYDWSTWGTILYLAILGSGLAFTLLFWVVQRVDVTVVAYQTFIIPLIALFFGWAFLDEAISPRLVLGSALILAGIAVASVRRSRSARTPSTRADPALVSK